MKVTISGLDKSFGTTRAVDGVDLVVREGELFFVLGPSGCGKTTLLRIVAGLETADAGTIRFGEEQMNDVPARNRNAAMVFQHYALWPHMTVAQNVEYGLKVRRLRAAERRERVAEALEMTGMASYAARRPSQLSGGQQQRVALARALVVRPDVLLLDEPLSNLDARLRRQMRREIRALQKKTGITTLYVTHDQEEALSMADRIALMRDGRVEQVAPPEELYHAPANPFVARFLGEANLIPGRVVSCGEGVCTVASAVGTVRAQTDSKSFAPGDSVLCMFRPESVRIDPEEGGIACTVARAAFAGDRADYELAWEGGEPIRAAVYNSRTILAEGARATFAVSNDQVSVMRE